MLTTKADWERQMFEQFVTASGLRVDLGSIASRKPPEPDIVLSAKGTRQVAELVEITDQDLAHRQAVSRKTRRVTGGALSHVAPLVSAFLSKSQKSYQTNGAPLMLLAYYDKQFPVDSVDSEMIPREVGHIVAEMVASGAWTRIWVYDSWEKRVLWVYP